MISQYQTIDTKLVLRFIWNFYRHVDVLLDFPVSWDRKTKQ